MGAKRGSGVGSLVSPGVYFWRHNTAHPFPPRKKTLLQPNYLSLSLSVVVVVTSVCTKEFLLPWLGLGRENEEEEERPFALLCSVPLSPLHNLWPSSLGASVVSGNTAKIKRGKSLFALVSTLVAHTHTPTTLPYAAPNGHVAWVGIDGGAALSSDYYLGIDELLRRPPPPGLGQEFLFCACVVYHMHCIVRAHTWIGFRRGGM